MKFLHLSDLHLGKRVNGYSMLEDQKYILNQILEVVKTEQTDAVVLAGDIYDKSVPPVEAVSMLDDFLVKLSKKKQQVFIISGNHDSAERLAFAGRLIENSGIHIAPVYEGHVCPIECRDAYGSVCMYLLPFVKPAHVKRFFPEEEIDNYTTALRVAVEEMHVDTTKRNVLVAHQFVTGALRSESEESIGGLDNVDASVFQAFDYVALGHIHGPQNIGSERLRYCGTPLKYSFSEKNHKKSVTVVELNEKNSVNIRCVSLVPKTDMYQLQGTYEELTARAFYEGKDFKNAYIHVVLTDEEDILNAAARLRVIYPKLMSLEYDNQRTRSTQSLTAAGQMENKTPQQLFEELFELQNNKKMSKPQSMLVDALVEKIWGEDI